MYCFAVVIIANMIKKRNKKNHTQNTLQLTEYVRTYCTVSLDDAEDMLDENTARNGNNFFKQVFSSISI